MKIKINKNKYFNAIFVLMLFSASLHMLILFYLAIIQKNIYILNYFNILDLDLLFPKIFVDNFTLNCIAFLVVIILYIYFLKKNTIDT